MKEGTILWIVNMAVILAVFYWSGKSSERIIYDRYLARLESVELEVADKKTAQLFYSKVLDLRKTKDSETSYFLPDNRSLLLTERPDPTKSHLLLRVRNGFERLHAVFKNNVVDEKLGTVGNIENKRFVISDPSGNRFTFLAWR